MNAPANWEEILKTSRFDLPQAKWDAMESSLRQRIRDERESSLRAAERPTLSDRLREALDTLSSWLAPTSVRWAGAGALGLLALGIGLWIRLPAPAATTASADLHWTPGQTLESVGLQEWDWSSGRSHIGLRDGAMNLRKDSAGQVRIQVARGTASFHVQHRAANESFHVGFGACHIEVVGTSFTIRVDSAESSARVEEGRVRFLGPGRDRVLDAGQELSCSPASGALHTESPIQESAAPSVATTRTSSKPTKALSAAAPSEADLAFDQTQRLCRNPGNACTEARADFVRRFSSDPRAAEIGWAWGESALASGDLRDALFAWDVAARSDKRIGIRATIAAVELRLGALPDAERAARDLDRILPELDAGSTLWVRGWTLRRDAARTLGQTAIQHRADSILAAPRAASGGS